MAVQCLVRCVYGSVPWYASMHCAWVDLLQLKLGGLVKQPVLLSAHTCWSMVKLPWLPPTRLQAAIHVIGNTFKAKDEMESLEFKWVGLFNNACALLL